jgi:hypothetical protein
MNSESSDASKLSDHATAEPSAHLDPITGEPGAHPVGVGVGAVSAGIAGAAIGAIAGPIGMVVGAAIGAVAGGLAGKEVAASEDEPVPLGERELPVETAAESVLPAVGLAGLPTGGMPAAALAASPMARHSAIEEEEPAEPFHEAYTTTTWQEAAAEERASEDAVAFDDGAEIPASAEYPVSEEKVRTAAYFRYLGRVAFNVPGDALQDWITAEHELASR